MESEKDSRDLFQMLPNDLYAAIFNAVWKDIDESFSFSEFAKLKLVNKKFKEFADSIMLQPQNILKILKSLDYSLQSQMDFINFYRSTLAYHDLEAKLLSGKKLNAFEVACYAFTTDDIKKIPPGVLQKASTEKNLDPAVAQNLEIMYLALSYDKNAEPSSFEQIQKKLLFALLDRNMNFINLAGVDWEGIKLISPNFIKLSSINFENANLKSAKITSTLQMIDMQKSNFKRCDLSFVTFMSTLPPLFTAANFENTNLQGTTLGGAILIDSTYIHRSEFSEAKFGIALNNLQATIAGLGPHEHELREAAAFDIANKAEIIAKTHPKLALHLIKLAILHPVFGHRDAKAVKEIVNSFTQFFKTGDEKGLPLIKTDSQKILINCFLKLEALQKQGPQQVLKP